MDKTTVQEYLDHCSKCGGCQAVCPLYGVTHSEPLVARGKLFLMKNYLDGNLELSPKMMELMSLCLLCKACTAQCPNRIPVAELVLFIRREIAYHKGIPFVKKNVFQHLLQNNGRLTLAAKLTYLYQQSGLQWLMHRSNILGLLPGELARKEKLLPRMNRIPFRMQIPKTLLCSKPRLRVGYFTGCLTNYVFAEIGHAVLKVLKNHNLEAVIPEQWCCGLPAMASGDQKSAELLARRNIESFMKAGIDIIITDCASCGSMLHQYGDLMGGRDARIFAQRVADFSQLMGDVIDFRPGNKEIRSLVTYHDPCHLGRGQGIVEAPRKLIRAVPGIAFSEMKESDSCCGAAGSFNLTHYDLANRVGHRKIRNIVDSDAETVITGCPSCIMQIRHQLELQEVPVQVMHLAELLSKTY